VGLRLFLIVAIALGIFWAVFKALRSRGTRSAHEGVGDSLRGIPGDDLKRLRNICRGDVEQMSRLIEYEKGRRPGINNDEACRKAIASLTRDNR
jgi:hypothetical protein